MKAVERFTRRDAASVTTSALWSARQLPLLGNALVQMALVWWVTDATRSAPALAAAAAAALLPGALLGPLLTGQICRLVSRLDRRWATVVLDGPAALASLVAAFMLWRGTAGIGLIYVVMFVRSLLYARRAADAWDAARNAVPDEHLATLARVDRLMQGVRVIGALPLSAWLMTLLPLYWILVADAVVAAAATAAVAVILGTVTHSTTAAETSRSIAPEMGARVSGGAL